MGSLKEKLLNFKFTTDCYKCEHTKEPSKICMPNALCVKDVELLISLLEEHAKENNWCIIDDDLMIISAHSRFLTKEDFE